MINFDDVTNGNKTEHNPKCPSIPDISYRILLIGGSGSGKNKCIITIKQIMIKYIYMQNIHMKQNINI